MSDDLDELRHLMDAATPAPDPDRRRADIARAERNFAALQ